MARNPWRGVVAVIVAIAVADCRSKPAPVEELFSTRMLGLSYLQRNQLPEAEIQFKKLIELAPNDPLGYTNLGLTYLQAGRFADAEKQLQRARELDPLNADIGLMLAKLYSLTGRPGEARATLEKLQGDTTASARVRLEAFSAAARLRCACPPADVGSSPARRRGVSPCR